MMRTRLGLGAIGVLLALFGVFRLLTQIPVPDLLELLVWIVGAVLIHDALVSPIMAGLGWVTTRALPPRARRYVQAGLATGGLVTIVAIPLIYREGSQPRAKSILLQNYGGNLTILLALIAAGCLVAYAVHVVLDYRRAHPAP